MSLRRFLAPVAVLGGESLVFLLVLIAVMRSLGDTSLPRSLLALGGVYGVIGAVPVPGGRRAFLVGTAAFLVPLLILGWIGWRTEYSLLFKHALAWESLPSVILAPANLMTSAFLACCAVAGLGLARRIRWPTRSRASDRETRTRDE